MHKTKTVKCPGIIQVYRNNKATIAIDESIVDVIEHLWKNRIITLGSCCGDGILDGRPNVMIHQSYSNNDIDHIVKLIKKVDDRNWMICQWRNVEVGKADKPVRPFSTFDKQNGTSKNQKTRV